MALNSLNGKQSEETNKLDLLRKAAEVTAGLAENSGISEIQEASRALLLVIANHSSDTTLLEVELIARETIDIPVSMPSSNGTHASTNGQSTVAMPTPTAETTASAEEPMSSEKMERMERDERLMRWWERTYTSIQPNVFRVQGQLLKRFLAMARGIAAKTCQKSIHDVIPRQISYRILNLLVHAFDPKKHGENFADFFKPLFTSALEHCNSTDSLDDFPEAPKCEHAAAIVEMLSESAPLTLQDIELVPEDDASQTVQSADARIRNSDANEHTQSAVTELNAQKELKSQRNNRLLQWARKKGVPGYDPFTIHGAMIRDCNTVAWSICHQSTQQESIDNMPLRTVAYRIVVHLAYAFDPERDGDVFSDFVRQYVPIALQRCIDKQSVESLIERPDFEQATAFFDALSSAQSSNSQSNPDVDNEKLDDTEVGGNSDTQDDLQSDSSDTNETDGDKQLDDKRTPDEIDGIPPAIDPLVEQENLRISNVLIYIREGFRAENVWEIGDPAYVEALEAMRRRYVNDQLQSGALDILKKITKNPDVEAVGTAINAIFDEAFATFNPPDATSDHFRIHLAECVRQKIADVYVAPTESANVSTRETRVIAYLQAHVPTAGRIREIGDDEYNAAVNELRETAVTGAIRSDAIKHLRQNCGISNPKTAQVERALRDLFDATFETFDPTDTEGDRFRGHFKTHAADKIKAAYEKHKHS